MNQVIIINGPSCAGKTTIAKEICSQSNNKFVHLQIDKAGEFYSTIFPKGFKFAENEIGTENNDDGFKGLFNNNRLARRKVVASILLATAKELLEQNFNIVIDTALDGPDAKELAQFYLEYIQASKITFVGIYCPVEERLKRLKTRKDNLFLTEDFIGNQTYQYNVFDSCKEFYDIWFDSSLLNGQEIAETILEHSKNAQKNISPKFAVRTSQLSDIDTMVSLSRSKRLEYEKVQPQFWYYAGESGDNAQKKWFEELLEDKNYLMFTAVGHCERTQAIQGNNNKSADSPSFLYDHEEVIGFIIGKVMPAPEVYNPGGLTLMIDDFCVKSENLWQSVGEQLIKEIKHHAKTTGVVQTLVVCGAHDYPKRKFLIKHELVIASEWFVGPI